MALKRWVGHELILGPWFVISQERINAFADCSEDWQFIHVDPARAAQTPLKGTIAHGFLTLSMLAPMCLQSFSQLNLGGIGLNYGFDKVRFLSPVHAGKRIRAHIRVLDVREKAAGNSLVRFGISVEIENTLKPALIADWLVMWLPAESVGCTSAPL